MTTNWKALCAELADALAEWQLGGGPPEDTADADLIDRARALLAEADGPAVPEVREPASVTGQPTRRQLMMLADEMGMASIGDAALYARAVLARWGNPAAAPVPEPGEVAELVVELRMMASQAAEACQFTDAENLSRAADLLQRLSPPQPVPVSERLPKPKDCDAEGRCWLWERDCGYSGCKWALVDRTWSLSQSDEDLSVYTHWLSAHALPVPEQEVSE